MKDSQFAKVVVFVSSLVPVTMMVIDALTGHAGPDMGAYMLHTSGTVALIFLLLSLSVTPLRKITGKNYWSLFRRMLGLYAFFYAGVHVVSYLEFTANWDFGALVADVFKRKFIFFGMGAFLIMIPLTLTSTTDAIKKMGAKRWKRLHQLVYFSAAAAAIHFCLLPTKEGFAWNSLPAAFATVLAVLLGFRVVVASRAWWTARAIHV